MTAVRAERTDAVRNREIVLRTAMRAFTDEGLAVSLGRIAQLAGVGAGTVYRHFPNKDILVEAVLAEQVNALATAAGQWAARSAPGEALMGLLLELIEKTAGRQHLCELLTADRSWPRAALNAAVRRFETELDRLLDNAQRAGAVRADLRVDDLIALTVGASALRSAHPDGARGRQLVRLMLDGLRTPSVTKTAAFRDTSRHETSVNRCAECRTTLPVRETGRPARYCGPTCRQRARRRRLTA